MAKKTTTKTDCKTCEPVKASTVSTKVVRKFGRLAPKLWKSK